MTMRWKKHKRETGLAAVGAGRYRASDYHDGTVKYATVYPSGGSWRGPLVGWYFVGRIDGIHINTCNQLVPTEAEAKANAEAWVKAALAAADAKEPEPS
jgi:hypothetical protein